MTLRQGFRAGLFACSLLTPLACPALARADAAADQARQIEGQIRTWLAGLLGPNIPLSDHPVQVTPEGDHFRLSMALAGRYGSSVSVAADPLTALVKPLDGNRWALDELRIPSPVRVDNAGPGKDMFKSWSAKIAEQTTKGVFDPTLATTTSFDTTVRGYTALTDTSDGLKTTHIDRSVSHTTWQPAGGGLVNTAAESAGEHLTSETVLPDGSPLKVSADRYQVTASATKVSFANIGAIIHAATALIPVQQAEAKKGDKDDGGGKGLPAAARGPLRAVVEAARNALGGLEEQISLDGMSVQSDTVTASLAHTVMGLGFGAPDGKVDLHMLFAMDGIDSPMIPPGPLRAYVPRHVSLRPRLSGVPSDDLIQLALRAIDSNGDDTAALEAQALGLLAKGPLSVGIDDLSLDSGPAALKATGSVAVSSPQDIVGQAQIRVTGFDALMQQASANPQLKQAAPVLIFLKGIGTQEGNAVLWTIAYAGGKLTVNGTDLSGMLPADKN